ncbi:hypothetical protein H6F89_27120 [Cyanobacteria bacterium FACHB-63]|nr:hypothetical protein [Cyanobacteria bacterium FACHB-63]
MDDDLRRAELMGSFGCSEKQVAEVLQCELTPEMRNAIARGAEQASSKSDYRKVLEDGDIEAGRRLLDQLQSEETD